MSSCMVHLLAAREYRPDASPLFYAANLAPDCIDIREIKDKTHFRLLTLEERVDALRELRDRSMGKGELATFECIIAYFILIVK